MSPAAARAMLDRQLAAHGTPVLVRRYTGPASAPLATWTDVPARMRETSTTETDVSGGIFAPGRKLILSPTDAGADVDEGVDAIMDGPTKRTITAWWPIKIGGEIVRIEAQAG